MSKKVVLKNYNDEVVRVFSSFEGSAYLIVRDGTKRLELALDLKPLDDENIKYHLIDKIELKELISPKEIKGFGFIDQMDNIAVVDQDVEYAENSSEAWKKSAIGSFSLALLFVLFLLNIPQMTSEIEEELKQHVVKIIKRTPMPKPQQMISDVRVAKKTQKTKVKKSVKRLGALAVLGRLKKKSRQIGGVNLGAVKTSPGPGLGGTQGSGGVQKSLYAKGLIAAPVGPGQNVKGAGGYGTKGKGGGRDGYGQMSLVGSTGTASIPLGKEAIIQGGLDQDLIAEVIRRNMGQVRFCYEQGLQGNPQLAGRVAVNFTIGGNGRVKIAGVKNTTLNSQLVEQCIVLRLKTWKFPLPEGGVDVKVSYPFLLRRLGTG